MIDAQRLADIRERLAGRRDDDEIGKILDDALDMLEELERLNDPHDPPTVMLESPYAGDVDANEDYARRCLLDSLRRGEAPLAGHLLYTQVLKDTNPTERELGLRADMAWLRRSRGIVLYTDNNVSSGMALAIKLAKSIGLPITKRKLGGYDAN